MCKLVSKNGNSRGKKITYETLENCRNNTCPINASILNTKNMSEMISQKRCIEKRSTELVKVSNRGGILELEKM